MTFNNDADISGDRARGGGGGRSRGRTGAAVGGGIGGLGLIVVLLFQVFTGQNVDLSGLTGQDQAQYQPEGGESVEECLTGQDANERIECRMDGTGLSLDQF